MADDMLDLIHMIIAMRNQKRQKSLWEGYREDYF